MILYEIFVCLIVLILLVCMLTREGYRGGRDNFPMRVPNPLFRRRTRAHGKIQRELPKDHYKDLKKYPRSKSEAAVIRHIEQLTRKPFPTVVPAWLGYELDGYNAELGIAVEFSGPLHTAWTPTREPYQDYFTRVMRDRLKLKVCAENNVKLIVVDASLPRDHWRNYVASRLYDFGLAPKPFGYIEPQVAEPYRNPHLEAELGLVDVSV